MAPQPHSAVEAAAVRSRLLNDLLESEGDRLQRQARRHSEVIQDADDALADACVAFLRRYEGAPQPTDALHWMLTAVRRAAWHISRRRRRRERLHPTVAIEETVEPLATSGPDPAEALERANEAACMADALDSLPPQEREALILLGLGCSYAEIAGLRNWSRAKVNKLLSEGRARVRCFLREGGESS